MIIHISREGSGSYILSADIAGQDKKLPVEIKKAKKSIQVLVKKIYY